MTDISNIDRFHNLSRLNFLWGNLIEVGDKVHMGVLDDPLCPPLYRGASRPCAEVIKKLGGENAWVVVLRAEGHGVVYSDMHSINPAVQYTPTKETEVNMMERMRTDPTKMYLQNAMSTLEHQYRGVRGTADSDWRSEVDAMKVNTAQVVEMMAKDIVALKQAILDPSYRGSDASRGDLAQHSQRIADNASW